MTQLAYTRTLGTEQSFDIVELVKTWLNSTPLAIFIGAVQQTR